MKSSGNISNERRLVLNALVKILNSFLFQPGVSLISPLTEDCEEILSFKLVCVVCPLHRGISRSAEICFRLQREEADLFVRQKLVNYFRIELSKSVMALDGIVRMFLSNRSSWLLFGLVCNEACKLLELTLWLSDVWAAYEESLVELLGGNLAIPILDIDKLRDEKKDCYAPVVNDFRNQLSDLWSEIEVRIFITFSYTVTS